MKINHIEDRDLEKLHHIREQLHNAQSVNFDRLRDLAELMRLILENVETAEVEVS